MLKARLLPAIAIALLLSGSATAGEIPSPEWYFGLGGGHSLLEPETGGSGFEIKDDIDYGWKLFGGYHFTDAIAVEAEYADLGTVTLKPYGAIDYTVYSLSGLYYVIERDNPASLGWSLFARAGVATIRNSSDVPFELDHAASLHFGFGGAWRINNDWSLRFDATTYDDDAAFTTASIVYYINEAAAVTVAEPPPPPPPGDSDNDGVKDPSDRCPGTLPDVIVDKYGCEPDTDLDKVIDRKDQCPGTPAGTVVDEYGCIPDKDLDDDGVVNDKDECPDTPAGTQVDDKGCDADPDQDGVHSDKDKCPDSPLGLKVDENGCTLFQARIRSVHFKSGSAVLSRNARNILNEIAGQLKTIPHVRLEIQAHTDSIGSDRDNQQLSQRRAEAVLVHLLNQGIDPGRLRARGYGESRPIDTNETAEGRANNRRVELREIRD